MTETHSKPRILFIARNYPPIFGGQEKNAEDFYTHMSPLTKVDLLANPKGKKHLPPFFLQAFLYLIQNGKTYDVIHFNDAVMSPLLPIIRLFSKAKVSFTINGLDIVYDNPFYQAIIPFFLRRADRLFPISSYTAQECKKRGIPSENMRIITVGITKIAPQLLDEFSISKFLEKYAINRKTNKVLVSIGRLVKRKGHSWFLENVFPLLPENSIYLIGGDGPERSTLETIITKKQLENRVYLLGRIPDEDKQAALQIADLFIMPNIRIKNDPEGFGIVLLEAGSYGVPVIASNIEGITSAVIDGVTGRLITEGDANGFVEAILHDGINRSGIRQAIEANYHWDQIAKKFLAEFEELTSTSNH